GKTARKIAPLNIIQAMIAANRATPFGEATCHGSTTTDTAWPPAAQDEYGAWPPADGLEHGERFCLIALSDGRYARLGMQHLGVDSWRAGEFRLPQEENNGGGGVILPGPTFPPVF